MTDVDPISTLMPPSPIVISSLETSVAILELMDEAPPRTMKNPSVVRSSPMSPSVRAMLERREFTRRYDTVPEPRQVQRRLPDLACPSGDVDFLADCRSFDDLRGSVEHLLAHR